MCGILGVLASRGERPRATYADIVRMRDRMEHRGPDGAGVRDLGRAILAHRRLSIRDLDHGAQPMESGRWTLVYNGELYEDDALRDRLRREGATFHTRCDTETLIRALQRWDIDAVPRLRGMFAFGAWDDETQRLILARDPLGVKPLYFAQLGADFVFASEIPALLAHPDARRQPNPRVVSSYLTTLRTTLGHETLFSGIYTLQPGEVAIVRADDGDVGVQVLPYWRDTLPDGAPVTDADVRACVAESVERHLVSDVPTCMLLSGGLDSAILGVEATRPLPDPSALQTFCAADPSDCGGDAHHARLMADHLGTTHHPVAVDRTAFADRWRELIDRGAMPVSTPNQTAILTVARALQPHATVALSGEGADELFGGYAPPMLSGLDGSLARRWGNAPDAERFRAELRAQYGTTALGDDVEHYLRCTSWVHPSTKAGLLTGRAFDAAERDHALRTHLADQLTSDRHADGELAPFGERLLRTHRRINLTGLLQRLDQCTMLASVEGRTPFADARVAELAMRMPLRDKLVVEPHPDGLPSSCQAILKGGRVTTKAPLRRAWADALPECIATRPKTSFPLPFQQWMRDLSAHVPDNEVVRSVFRPGAIDMLREGAITQWPIAWPVWNIAYWLTRWCA